MALHLVGRDPLGGPAAVWIDTEDGSIVLNGLKALPEDVKDLTPGMEAIELPDRMRPILQEAADLIRALGLDKG